MKILCCHRVAWCSNHSVLGRRQKMDIPYNYAECVVLLAPKHMCGSWASLHSWGQLRDMWNTKWKFLKHTALGRWKACLGIFPCMVSALRIQNPSINYVSLNLPPLDYFFLRVTFLFSRNKVSKILPSKSKGYLPWSLYKYAHKLVTLCWPFSSISLYPVTHPHIITPGFILYIWFSFS